MLWTYDPAVDALTIQLGKQRRSARTAEMGSGIVIDFDKSGNPITIEILDASGRYPRTALNALPLPVAMVPLRDAAQRAGLLPATLRQQIRNRRLHAVKRSREWWITPQELDRYLASRAPQGRPASTRQARSKGAPK
jgi:uncharacterized protein YuzE